MEDGFQSSRSLWTLKFNQFHLLQEFSPYCHIFSWFFTQTATLVFIMLCQRRHRVNKSANCRHHKRMVGCEVGMRLSFLGAPVCWIPVSNLLNAWWMNRNSAISCLHITICNLPSMLLSLHQWSDCWNGTHLQQIIRPPYHNMEESKPVNSEERNCGHGGHRLNRHGHRRRVDETKEHFALCLVHCRWGEDGLGKRVDDYKS